MTFVTHGLSLKNARLAALFCPSLSLVLFNAVLCTSNGLQGIDALSCSRVRILFPGDTNNRYLVQMGIFSVFSIGISVVLWMIRRRIEGER